MRTVTLAICVSRCLRLAFHAKKVQILQPRWDASQLRKLLTVFRDDRAGAAVPKEKCALLRRAGRIDGDGNEAGHGDRHVAQQPFQPCLAQQGHSITTSKSQRDKPGRDFPRLLVRLAPGQGLPILGSAKAKGRSICEFPDPALPDAVCTASCCIGNVAFAGRHGRHIVIGGQAQIKTGYRRE